MRKPFQNWLGMDATIPARIQPSSIDHASFPHPCKTGLGGDSRAYKATTNSIIFPRGTFDIKQFNISDQT